jgi:hypothetical protein
LGKDVDELPIEMIAPFSGILRQSALVKAPARNVVQNEIRLGSGWVAGQGLSSPEGVDLRHGNGGLASYITRARS